MSSSKRAQKASDDNADQKVKKDMRAYEKAKAAIKEKYRDRGTHGRDQMKKELLSLEMKRLDATDKRIDKRVEDRSNKILYGKDAMKGRTFANYNKGGYVNCGASTKPSKRRVK
jgi:hypothetical protein